MRIVQRTFSGYRLSLPEQFSLVYVDPDGRKFIPPESMFGINYWMKVRMIDINPIIDHWVEMSEVDNANR